MELRIVRLKGFEELDRISTIDLAAGRIKKAQKDVVWKVILPDLRSILKLVAYKRDKTERTYIEIQSWSLCMQIRQISFTFYIVFQLEVSGGSMRRSRAYTEFSEVDEILENSCRESHQFYAITQLLSLDAKKHVLMGIHLSIPDWGCD